MLAALAIAEDHVGFVDQIREHGTAAHVRVVAEG